MAVPTLAQAWAAGSLPHTAVHPGKVDLAAHDCPRSLVGGICAMPASCPRDVAHYPGPAAPGGLTYLDFAPEPARE